MSTGGRILVVDDTPVNLKLLADLLTAKGYSIVTAASGAEALDEDQRCRARHRPARRDDARHERLRRVPQDP